MSLLCLKIPQKFPIAFRIQSKILSITHKALHDLYPAFSKLISLCAPLFLSNPSPPQLFSYSEIADFTSGSSHKLSSSVFFPLIFLAKFSAQGHFLRSLLYFHASLALRTLQTWLPRHILHIPSWSQHISGTFFPQSHLPFCGNLHKLTL